ncbi:unnamed protein product [Lactuca saligna]|uniref:DDE Tnp4 domain-containing protein n=1 Tax=Lactuca saligna TaxID=75948 RepID=A0AA36EDK1_LACSI|nr:unnamed protein product [Lactuca saligna]
MNLSTKLLISCCPRFQDQGHPKAASLKTVLLLFPELCAELFDGNSASGNLNYATSQTSSGHGPSSFHVAPLHLMDAPSINIDEDDFFSKHTSEHFTQPSPSTTSSSVNSPSAASPSVPTSFNLNPNIPGHNRRLRQVIKGAVGALDGTLIHVVVSANKRDLYRSRGKGDCYQNVLVICDFNMMFTFVVTDWEGIAHDSRILSEALANPHAPFSLPPPYKYYLFDVAYANIRGFMTPYRNVRYWLGDFR